MSSMATHFAHGMRKDALHENILVFFVLHLVFFFVFFCFFFKLLFLQKIPDLLCIAEFNLGLTNLMYFLRTPIPHCICFPKSKGSPSSVPQSGRRGWEGDPGLANAQPAAGLSGDPTPQSATPRWPIHRLPRSLQPLACFSL